MELNDILTPLIAKGQSINHIFASHADEIGLSEKTIYNYIDMNAFQVRNIDLPKKVRYRQRHPHDVVMKMDYQYRKGRSYTDFTSFMEQNPKLPIWETDTVKGARGSHKVLLTMILRDTNFMLIFLLPDGTQKSVLAVFDKLTMLLGIETFRKIFPVILTDNGVEFKGSHHLEFTENGARRTRVFYCDPQASWQKGRVEKNHVLIRQILPKGTSFRLLEDTDIHLITCHVNSVVRELFENQTPFDLMQKEEHQKLLKTLALFPIPADEVCLKPKLLKRKK
jgi:IS30 family transposase